MRCALALALALASTACGSEVIRETESPPGIVVDATATDLTRCVRNREPCRYATVCPAPLFGDQGVCRGGDVRTSGGLGSAWGIGDMTVDLVTAWRAEQLARGCDVPIWPEVRCDALTDP